MAMVVSGWELCSPLTPFTHEDKQNFKKFTVYVAEEWAFRNFAFCLFVVGIMTCFKLRKAPFYALIRCSIAATPVTAMEQFQRRKILKLLSTIFFKNGQSGIWPLFYLPSQNNAFSYALPRSFSPVSWTCRSYVMPVSRYIAMTPGWACKLSEWRNLDSFWKRQWWGREFFRQRQRNLTGKNHRLDHRLQTL